MMRPTLGQLTWLVARDVNRTIGGGMAGIELLRRTFERRGWVDAPAHGVFVAVSRLTPGTNVLAYCAAAGWRLHGWRGTLAAVAAASLPASLIVFTIAATLVRLDRYAAVRVALSAGMLVAAALVFASAWSLMKPYLRAGQWLRTLGIAALAISLYLVGLTPVRVLLISAVVGALLPNSRPLPGKPRRGSADSSPPAPPTVTA